MINWNITKFDEVSSTNTELKMIPNAEVGTVIVADKQTAGRGRHGRSWISEVGNLYASFLLPIHQTGQGAQLGFLLGLAASEAISSCPPLEEGRDHKVIPGGMGGDLDLPPPNLSLPNSAPPQGWGNKAALKWPNDLLLNGKKCGGVLLENMPKRNDVAIAGIGINISSYPDDVMFPATSLSENSIKTESLELLAEICTNLSLLLSALVTEGFSEIRNQWLKKAAFIGEKIHINMPDGQIHGVFKDLDASGAIILMTEGGEKVISAGDVFLL
jgi:BirA family transcriptional regulator, biotin operon repressor / biotin---[acetyl-CoA-carboxylase] ligase